MVAKNKLLDLSVLSVLWGESWLAAGLFCFLPGAAAAFTGRV